MSFPPRASLAFALALVGAPADAAPAGQVTVACLIDSTCFRPLDRQVHPFEGTLGRPCGYRTRQTPSGPRKVRVCF